MNIQFLNLGIGPLLFTLRILDYLIYVSVTCFIAHGLCFLFRSNPILFEGHQECYGSDDQVQWHRIMA